MDISCFIDKSKTPVENDLTESLDKTYQIWKSIKEYVLLKYPEGVQEWNYPGVKYGWSFKIKDKKRAIVYFLPRDKYFKVAFVFGQKAYDAILESNISKDIKTELENAKVYAEGRGIRIDIKDMKAIIDVKKLIDIKLAH